MDILLSGARSETVTFSTTNDMLESTEDTEVVHHSANVTWASFFNFTPDLSRVSVKG